MELTQQQMMHALSCLQLFTKSSLDKYADGQKTHGGNMWEKPGMIHNAYMEIIDQMYYISTIGQQVDLALKLLDEGHIDKCKQILANLLITEPTKEKK